MITIGRFDLANANLREVIARLFTGVFDILLFQANVGKCQMLVRSDHCDLRLIIHSIPPHMTKRYVEHKRLYFSKPVESVVEYIKAALPDQVEEVRDTIPDHK